MKPKTAFTLVELLVVIGIISILVAMLLPALNAAREAAKTVACASNMRQVAMAAHMYSAENNGQLPYAYDRGSGPNDPLRRVTFFSLMAPQLGLKYDPMNPYASQWYEDSVLHCPSDDLPRNPVYETYREGGRSSYCVNGFVSDVYTPQNPSYTVTGASTNAGTRKMSQIPSPSTTILLVENWEWLGPFGVDYSAGVWGYGGYSPVTVYIQSISYGYATGVNTPAALDMGKQGYHNRSNGRGICNWAFADGHVDAMNWKQTVQPRNLWRVELAKQAQEYNPGPQFFVP